MPLVRFSTCPAGTVSARRFSLLVSAGFQGSCVAHRRMPARAPSCTGSRTTHCQHLVLCVLHSKRSFSAAGHGNQRAPTLTPESSSPLCPDRSPCLSVLLHGVLTTKEACGFSALCSLCSLCSLLAQRGLTRHTITAHCRTPSTSSALPLSHLSWRNTPALAARNRLGAWREDSCYLNSQILERGCTGSSHPACTHLERVQHGTWLVSIRQLPRSYAHTPAL